MEPAYESGDNCKLHSLRAVEKTRSLHIANRAIYKKIDNNFKRKITVSKHSLVTLKVRRDNLRLVHFIQSSAIEGMSVSYAIITTCKKT